MTEAAGGPGLVEMLRLAGSLALVAALVVASGWALRRTSAGRRKGLLAVEERVPLARGVQLVLVRVDGRRLVLGVAEKAVTLVTELEDDAREEAGDRDGTSRDAVVGPPKRSNGLGATLVEDLATRLVARWRARA